MKRVVIVGSTGAGKSTLARLLATKLNVEQIELDALHWLPDWEARETESFRRLVDSATQGACWVIDGNYSVVRDIVWGRADTIIWLDYHLTVILWRLIPRTLNRILSRKNLWGSGNRETVGKAFFSGDSILVWALKTYRRRRRNYTYLMTQPEYDHVTFHRFRSPRATKRWLQLRGWT